MSPLIFALEGIGGCGKSHVGRLVSKKLESDHFSVLNHKVAGLGSSPRVEILKSIMNHRYYKRREGQLTKKETIDQLRDKIFRLAMRCQIKELNKKIKEDKFDFVIIDRTPLMLWVYAKATNALNPYLKEIEEEAIFTTKNIGITNVFLFDIPPEIAYSRMIARYCVDQPNVNQLVQEACNIIQAPSESGQIISVHVKKLLSKAYTIDKKPFESWDLIPYSVTKNERELHKKILGKCQEQFGLGSTIIDATHSVEQVTQIVYNKIITVNDLYHG